MTRLQRFGIYRHVTWGVAPAVSLRTFGAEEKNKKSHDGTVPS